MDSRPESCLNQAASNEGGGAPRLAGDLPRSKCNANHQRKTQFAFCVCFAALQSPTPPPLFLNGVLCDVGLSSLDEKPDV